MGLINNLHVSRNSEVFIVHVPLSVVAPLNLIRLALSMIKPETCESFKCIGSLTKTIQHVK